MQLELTFSCLTTLFQLQRSYYKWEEDRGWLVGKDLEAGSHDLLKGIIPA